jgi:hypothetical protein
MDAPDVKGTRRIMTLAFLRLSADERKLYIDEGAARRGLSPVILEKETCFRKLLPTGVVMSSP